MNTYKLVSMTVKTPIREMVEYNRDYVYGRKFIAESIEIINAALDREFPGQRLTDSGKKFLRREENEALLVHARNWAVYYMRDSEDYHEFNRALLAIMEAMTIDKS